MSQYLSEAFKKLEFLNEDTFPVTEKGLKDFVEFEDKDDEEDIVTIIDDEADTIDDISDSYVGKVILDCCVCHSKLYKDVEDVIIEDDLANVGEECPFCYTGDGYKVIGQVATFGEEAEEKDDEEKAEETKDGEELEESVVSKKSKNKRVREFLPTPPMPNVGGLFEDEEKDLDEFMDANITLDAKGFGGKDNNVSVLGGKIPFGEDKEIEEGIFDKFRKNKNSKEAEPVKDNEEPQKEEEPEEKKDVFATYSYDEWIGALESAHKYWAEDGPEAAKMKLGSKIFGNLYKDIVACMDAWMKHKGTGNFPHKTYAKHLEEAHKAFETDDELTEGIFGIKTKKDKEREAKEKAAKEAKKKADKEEAERREQERQADVARGWGEWEERKRQAERDYNRRRYDSIRGDKPSNTGYRGVNYSGGDYYSEGLKEGIFDKKSSADVNNAKREYDNAIKNALEGGNLMSMAATIANCIPEAIEEFRLAYDDYSGVDGSKAEGSRAEQKKSQVLSLIEDAIKQLKKPSTFTLPAILVSKIVSTIVEKFASSCDSVQKINECKTLLNAVNKIEADKSIVKETMKKFFETVVNQLTQKHALIKKLPAAKLMFESINNLSIDTDDTHMEMASDENGKVTISTEPLTNTAELDTEETITEVDPETQEEISSNVSDGEEIEIDVEEFDEESFDELGEGFLKRVYENVDSFHTSNVVLVNDKLKVEGLIKFSSGNVKKTNFIFESREATKSGMIRFVGKNEELSRGKKSFTVTGRMSGNKFMSESLNYNYGVKNSAGKVQRLYGTIKNK